MNIKKNDTVIVLSGKDKGVKGKVLVAMPSENKVIVEGNEDVSDTEAGISWHVLETIDDADAALLVEKSPSDEVLAFFLLLEIIGIDEAPDNLLGVFKAGDVRDVGYCLILALGFDVIKGNGSFRFAHGLAVDEQD